MGKPSDTSNYIYRSGTAPNTRAAVSQKNKIYGYMVNNGGKGFQQIGVVSEFTTDESRTIDPIRGVGFGDMVAELVPGVTEPMTMTINKSLLYAVNLFQVVGYKGGVDGLVRSLKHHRWPFDIKQELVFSELSGDGNVGDVGGAVGAKTAMNQPSTGGFLTPIKALFTFFEGCWFESYGVSYTSDAAIVGETSSVKCTDVIDGANLYGEFIDTGLAPGLGGGPGQGYSLRFASASNVPQTGLV